MRDPQRKMRIKKEKKKKAHLIRRQFAISDHENFMFMIFNENHWKDFK